MIELSITPICQNYIRLVYFINKKKFDKKITFNTFVKIFCKKPKSLICSL